jgi:hypothetical protein
MMDAFGPQGGKAAMDEAMNATTEGTRAAVTRAHEDEKPAAPAAAKPDRPNVVNTPRKDGEDHEAYLNRVAALRATYDGLHPDSP